MEIFADGGLFELAAALALVCGMNDVFKRKRLLLLFSVLAVASPFLLRFLSKGEIHCVVAAISIGNALLLTMLP